MKIIDAHLHLFPAGNELTDKMVKSVGHENSAEHLRKVYGELDMAHGIIMGTAALSLIITIIPPICFTTASGWTARFFAKAIRSSQILPRRWSSI